MWKESFAIGVDRIDSQHKDLFRALAAAQRSLHRTVRSSDYKQYCMNTLYFLKNYMKHHFYDEESYMDSIKYEGLEEHKRIHDTLANDLHKFETRVIDSDYDSALIRESLDTVIALFIRHVVSDDQKIPKGNASNMYAISSSSANKAYIDQISDDVENKASQVLQLMAGFEITRASTGIKSSLQSDICFKVNLVGEAKKSLGFIYSKGISLEVFKSITGKEMVGVDDIVKSALSEMSCIIAGKISDAVVASGTPCDIEAPTDVTWNSFPENAEHVMLSTKAGDMVIVVFDKR